MEYTVRERARAHACKDAHRQFQITFHFFSLSLCTQKNTKHYQQQPDTRAWNRCEEQPQTVQPGMHTKKQHLNETFE